MEKKYITEEYIDRAICGDTRAILKILEHYAPDARQAATKLVKDKKTGSCRNYIDKEYENRMLIKLILDIQTFNCS